MKEYKELWPGGLWYAGDPVGSDSLALADFVRAVKASRVWDLGCGCGILLLLLGHERKDLFLQGVEIRSAAAEQARLNMKRNGFSARCEIVTGDLRSSLLPAGSADLAVSNPPYFPAGSGAVPQDPRRAAMRTESASVGQLCSAAARLLREGGSFCLVHRYRRMTEVLGALSAAGLEPKRLRLLSPAPDRQPWAFLCEAQKGAVPGVVTEKTLFQWGEGGRETAEYRRICHWEAEE